MTEERQRYTVGVDVGTESARVCVIDTDGTLIATSSRPTQTWNSQTNCYEQSTHNIWNSICESLKTAISDSAVNVDAVEAIVFDATCSLAVFDRDRGQPVTVALPLDNENDDHNVVLWMHRAAMKEAELINSADDPVIQHLGGSISPFMAIAKILWLKNNMAKSRFQKCRFFDLEDALSFMATGIHHVECDASCEIPKQRDFGVDGTIKGWNSQFLQRIGLGCLVNDEFGQIGGVCKHGKSQAIGSPVGNLCTKAAADLGLTTNVIVGTGVIDCYAGWIGSVGTLEARSLSDTHTSASGRLAIVAGTSACHILVSESSQFVKGLWGPYDNFLLPAAYTIAGGQPAVGRLLQHVIETHPAHQDAKRGAKSRNQTIFDYLNDHLHYIKSTENAPSITYLGRHIFFYGDHFGNRTPIADANMTGSIIGLTGDTTITNLAIMYYSTMEFLALQTRHIIDTMTSGGHNIRSIHMSGSVCQNDLFTKLLATICNLPVVIPSYAKSAVCYGSAVLAAHTLAISKEPSQSNGLWSIMTKMSKAGETIHPDRDEYVRGLLEVKYTVFLEQAERQRVFRRMIDNVPRS